MIESLLGELPVAPELRSRIAAGAEGNPLFAEEMVAMLQGSPDGDVTVPPTIQALLAARLDQLEPSERGVLQRGSVEGRVFHWRSGARRSPRRSCGRPRCSRASSAKS